MFVIIWFLMRGGGAYYSILVSGLLSKLFLMRFRIDKHKFHRHFHGYFYIKKVLFAFCILRPMSPSFAEQNGHEAHPNGQSLSLHFLLCAQEEYGMLYYKMNIIKIWRLHIFSRNNAEQLQCNKTGVSNFLKAFRKYRTLNCPLPKGLTNYDNTEMFIAN